MREGIHANERRPAGAASEAAKPKPSLALTVRLRIDLGSLSNRSGYLTEEGVRQAREVMEAALAAPVGALAVLCVGRLHTSMVDYAMLSAVRERFHIEIEADRPDIAAEWYQCLAVMV